MTTLSSRPMLPDYATALAQVLGAVQPVACVTVPLAEAVGRVLRAEVRADRPQPPFDRSTMDGFAVQSGSVQPGVWFPVAGDIPAGAATPWLTTPMPAGQVLRIATGAPLPPGADAVIPVEQANVEGARVCFVAEARAGQHVHPAGSDARAGAVVLAAGTWLRAQHLGIAAAVGAVQLVVQRQVRVAWLTTGDEVVDPATPTAALQPQQIRNANGPMVHALVTRWGAQVVQQAHLPDDPQATQRAAVEALQQADLVITNGGVSAGVRDFLPSAWEQLGLQTLVRGVAIQPGKPVLACAEATPQGRRLRVLGLPGNPVSVWCTAHLFVQPVLRALAGAPAELPWRPAPLQAPVPTTAQRQVFRAGHRQQDGSVAVIPWHGSGDLVHTATAEVLVQLPRQEGTLPAGTVVPTLDV